MMKTKKIPMRMCLGCGEMRPKRELIRVVKSKRGISPLTSQAKNQAEALIYAKASNALRKQEKQESLKEAFPA